MALWWIFLISACSILILVGCERPSQSPSTKEKVAPSPGESPTSAPKNGAPSPGDALGEASDNVGQGSARFDFSELDSFLQKHRRLFKSAAVLIRRNGKIIYTSGDVDAPVPAASCSKWLGASAIMKLVETHKLDLDTPASVYLGKLRPRVDTLTLRQLLSHTGGLRSFLNEEEDAPSPGLPAASLFPLRRSGHGNLRFRASKTPAFCYENSGFNFAGEIASRVAHKAWPSLFKEEIAIPLQMSRTWFAKHKPSLAGGAMVSAADYSRFLEMFRKQGTSLEGVTVLAAATVSEMLKNQTALLPMECVPHRSPRKESYGLGLWRQGPSDLPALASHFGTSGYKVFLDTCRNLTAVFAMEFKGTHKAQARMVTRDIYKYIQRVIPVSASCAFDTLPDATQWHPPMRPPASTSE